MEFLHGTTLLAVFDSARSGHVQTTFTALQVWFDRKVTMGNHRTLSKIPSRDYVVDMGI
jgi:hypothetical protein